MEVLFDPRLLPPPRVGERYSSVFRAGDPSAELPLWDLRGTACSIAGGHVGVVFPCSGYDLKVLQVSPLLLWADTDSWFSTSPSSREPCFPRYIVDICSGMGAMSLGPRFLGCETLAYLEINELARAHLKRNTSASIISGSVCHDSVLKQLHQKVDDFDFAVCSGFPCQPFSVQGHQGHQKDERALVFWGTLRSLLLLQPVCAWLECTPGAGSDQGVQDGLQQLCVLLNWQRHELVFDLADQWPMHRRRWWCALYPSSWTGAPLRPWPRMVPPMQIGHVLDSWGCWPLHHEEDLQLSASELQAYSNAEFGSDARLLHSQMASPTVLHSYGCALSSCPCGCRDRPLALTSLLSKGLRGSFVISEVHMNPRFLHPEELAILLTLPMGQEWDTYPRSSLCLLGQCAAPLQSLWVFVQMLNASASTVPGLHRLDPDAVLAGYKAALQNQVVAKFPAAEPPRPQALRLRLDTGAEFWLLKRGTVTVSQLLQAEHISLGWGETACCTSAKGQLARDEVINEEFPIQLWHHPKRQRRDPPVGLLVIGIEHHGSFLISCLEAGSFLFEALYEHHLIDVDFLVNEDGKVFGKDYRVWCTLRLKTITPASFPRLGPLPICSSSTQAFGEFTCLEEGLAGATVWQAMVSLCQSSLQGEITEVVQLHPGFLDQLRLGSITQQQCVALRYMWHQSAGYAVGCFSAQGHWAVLCCRQDGDELHGAYYDGLRSRLQHDAWLLFSRLADLFRLQLGSFTSHCLVRQEHSTTCGTVALAHVALLLGLQGSFTPNDIWTWHQWLLQHQQQSDSLCACGPEDPTLNELAVLLHGKGVPAAECKARALAAMTALGRGPVLNAMAAKNPWQKLKGLASKPATPFRFLTPAELSEYIDQQSKLKHGTSHKEKKQKSQAQASMPKPIELDPKQLRFVPAHFRDQDGDEVPQIDLSQVLSGARGLAICTRRDAQPFIDDFAAISTDALGLLLTSEVDSSEKGAAKIGNLRYPVTYLGTGEQILINGALLTLGDLAINRHLAKGPDKDPDHEKSVVIRVQAFKDELPLAWTTFVQAPLKHIIQMTLPLQTCEGQACGANCGRFHPAVDAADSAVIHEIWARRFCNLDSKTVSAELAECFCAFMRIAEPALKQVVASCVEGLYFEPRASTGTGSHPDYLVVWLPPCSRQDAVHKLRTASTAISLVRFKTKYGLRVGCGDAEALHLKLRPNTAFFACKPTFTYRAHPLPHGLDRKAMTKLLSDWGWKKARPLQPTRGSSIGGAWLIGADEEPPSPVVTAFKADVLLNLLPAKETVERQIPFFASRRTIQHAKSSGTPTPGKEAVSSDPWQNGSDPWKGFVPTVAPTTSSAGRKALDDVADKLRADIKAQVSKEVANHTSASSATSSVTDLQAWKQQSDERFQKLECGLKELGHQQHTMKQWCQETAQKLQISEQQQHQLNQNIQQVQAEVQTSSQQLHQQVRSSLDSLRADFASDVESKFTAQFERFEALLAKKHRTE